MSQLYLPRLFFYGVRMDVSLVLLVFVVLGIPLCLVVIKEARAREYASRINFVTDYSAVLNYVSLAINSNVRPDYLELIVSDYSVSEFNGYFSEIFDSHAQKQKLQALREEKAIEMSKTTESHSIVLAVARQLNLEVVFKVTSSFNSGRVRVYCSFV